MNIASALRQAFAMFYRPLVRLVDVLGRIGLGLLQGRVVIPGEFRFLGMRHPEAPKAESRAETAEPSRISYPLVMESGDLPAFWEESTVIVLPVNPYLIHAYWYVDDGDLERARGRMDDRRSQPALRIYDITDRVSRASFDVDIQLEAGNWYVHLWSPARSYCVELGFKTEDGRFYPMARSNVVQTPRAFPSDKVEEESYVKMEGEHARGETLPPPNPALQAKADTAPKAAGTSVPIHPHTPESPAKAEPSRVPGQDTEFMEHAEAGVIEERQPLQPSQIQQSLDPGRQARFAAWGDEKELVADITANNERRLDFGVSSGK